MQQNIKRLDKAYENFFSGRGFPKFKNRSNFKSFTYSTGIKIDKNRIYLPKLGWMRFFNSRLIPEGFKIKAATVRKCQDGWYVSIRIEDKEVPSYIAKPLTEVKSVIGCDLGITKLVHLSNGHQIDNPKFATNKKTKRILRIRQCRVSRKVKGSKNRKKAAFLVGRLHKKITDKRSAREWKVAKQVTSLKADGIGLEDLNVSGMMRRCKVKIDEKTGRFLKNGQSRKKAFNRAIADASWSKLILKIEYLAAKQYKAIIKINPQYSSTECRNCGHKDKSNRENEKFICTACGFMTHADIGASRTIRDRALSKVRVDCSELIRPEHCKEISLRDYRKRGEPGNPSDRDIKTAMS